MTRMRRSDEVVADVMGKIARKELQGGDRLPTENELADSYGVGKSTIREAVQTLSAKGLLIARQGSGTVVAPVERWSSLDPDFIEVTLGDDRFTHLIEARRIFEPSIAKLAAIRATDEEVGTLGDICARHHQIDVEDRKEHAQIDIDFHSALAAATHNPVLESMHASITGLGRELRFASAEVPGAIERAIVWHEQVMEAIQHHDALAAESAMHLHMRQVNQEFLRTHGKAPVEPDEAADLSGPPETEA